MGACCMAAGSARPTVVREGAPAPLSGMVMLSVSTTAPAIGAMGGGRMGAAAAARVARTDAISRAFVFILAWRSRVARG